MRGVTRPDYFVATALDISIHTPHAGSDVTYSITLSGMGISIHTPHAGSDYIP